MAGDGPIDKSVSEHFKLVFLSVLGLTVATLLASVCMSVFVGSPDSAVNGAITWTSSLCKIGFGTIIGLLGGRTG